MFGATKSEDHSAVLGGRDHRDPMKPEDAIATLSQLDLASAPQEKLWPLLRALGATTEEVKARLVLVSGPRAAPEIVSNGEAESKSSDWVTVKEAAARYPLSTRWFYRKAGILPFIKRVGPKKILVHEPRLRRWLERVDGYAVLR